MPLLYSIPRSSKLNFNVQVSRPKFCTRFSPCPCILHAPLIRYVLLPPSRTDIRSTRLSSEEVLWLLVLPWRQTQKHRPQLCAVLTEIRRFSKWNVSDVTRNVFTCRMSTVQKISCRRQWPVETPAVQTATNRQRDRECWRFVNIFWFTYEKMLPRGVFCLCERSP